MLGLSVVGEVLSRSLAQFLDRLLWRCPLEHQSSAVQMGALAESLKGPLGITLRDVVHEAKTAMGTGADHFSRQADSLQFSKHPEIVISYLCIYKNRLKNVLEEISNFMLVGLEWNVSHDDFASGLLANVRLLAGSCHVTPGNIFINII